MNEYGVVSQPNTVRFERLLPGPIERVWEYLAESEKRRTWLAGGPMELRVGGRVELEFNNKEIGPKGETIPERFKNIRDGVHRMEGRILRCEPPRVLSFTWGGRNGSAGDSEVTFELTPQGEQVLLLLTHRRLPDKGALIGVGGGWHTHLGVLVEQLNGRQPSAFWSVLDRYDEEYGRRIGRD